jgi:hypothetical protein
MPTLNLKTHDVTVNKQGEATGIRVTPYIRLCEGDGPPVFLQNGGFFYEGGEEVPKGKVPDFVFDLMKKCDPEALKACGFKAP